MFKRLLVLMLLATSSFAAEYYVATDGNDTTENGSNSTPWATFAYAFSQMSAGDTLWVKDGTYTEQMTGFPDGTSGAYTSVKAVNDWAVTVVGGLYGNGDDYVYIQGFHFDGGGVLSAATYIKIIKCSFYGASTADWNVSTFCTTSNCTDILLEDCFAYGTGRYKFLIYISERVILRRCVARHDFHPSIQCALFHRYSSTNVEFQNCIGLDSGIDGGENGGFVGGIFNDNHDPRVDNSGKNLGCILLNFHASCGISDNRIYGTRTIDNCVIWDTPIGIGAYNYDTPASTVNVTHCTVGALNITTGWEASTAIFGEAPTMYKASVLNTIVTGAITAIKTMTESDYNCLYDNDTNYSGVSAGAHDNTNNPSLLYIVRAESASGNASDSGYIGATVLKKYGVDGTLWGETGYETLTNEDLWPFPNEAVIKQKMGAYSVEWDAWGEESAGSISGARGFCTGTSIDGSPQTLTKYIWEYLGNEIPADIYGKSEPVRRRLSISGGVTITGGVQLK